ncbi:MAG: DUF2656 domain-containing protein [Symploca sp. SIO2E6]|nr:DUF2656 domain-containing protein [Symploca sp. SIO2E6]
MLLSHNFNISPEIVPPLSKEEFVEVFRVGLSAHSACQCRLLNHPHWITEILFSTSELAPQQIGELCAQAMRDKRQTQHSGDTPLPNILVLGGIKTTPATSNSPDALQPGNWGVDVVETTSSQAFLQEISWDTTIAQKPADSFFKIEFS